MTFVFAVSATSVLNLLNCSAASSVNCEVLFPVLHFYCLHISDMEVALTFGSVGDIITVCQLAAQLTRALRDSCGSIKEYRELQRDLEMLLKVLMQVGAVA
jgi:uncharacterized MnhB-related membrane protein